jgi:hypothetical protein
MTIRITEKHDAMLLQLMAGSGLSAANRDTMLSNVKTYLDATYPQFKDPATGTYTVPHVLSAFNVVRSRGK